MPTAAARRAAQADKEREKRNEYQRRYRECHAEELKIKRREKAQKKKAEETEELAAATPYPADTVIAAAVNMKYRLSVVETEGHSGNRHVFVENVHLDGEPVHRLKVVEYRYFKSFSSALAAARASGIRLQLFGTDDHDA